MLTTPDGNKDGSVDQIIKTEIAPSGKRKVLSEIAYHASINSITPCIEASFNFIDVVILANKSLSTSALINIYQNLITTSCCVVLGSASTIVSRAHGERELSATSAISKIRHTLKGGMIMSLMLSVPAFGASLGSRQILSIIQQPEELLDGVQDYFSAYSWGMPAILIVHLEKQIALGVSDIRAVNMLALFDGATISLLGYLLVNGKFGLPELGIAGIGYAATITNFLDLLFFSLYLKYSSRYKEYKFDLLSEFSGSFAIFEDMLRIGIPVGIQIGTELLIVLGYSALVGKIGENALSAYQVSAQYILLTSIPTYGLTQSALLLVARETGARRIQNAKRIGTICIMIGGSVSLIILGLSSGLTKQLMKPFIDIEDPSNQEIISNAQMLFLINGIAQIFDSVRLISAGAIQSAFKETRVSMLVSIVGYGLIGLSTGYFLGSPARSSVIGVCIGKTIGLAISGCSLLGYWWNKIKNWLSPQEEDTSNYFEAEQLLPTIGEERIDNTDHLTRRLEQIGSIQHLERSISRTDLIAGETNDVIIFSQTSISPNSTDENLASHKLRKHKAGYK